MKLLFITNLYPPAGSGGYEQWCQEVAEGLRLNGHHVSVLTSRRGVRPVKSKDPKWVHRLLYMEMEFASLVNGLNFFAHREVKENKNLEILRERVTLLQPDAIVIWSMWNLHRSLAALAEELLPGRVVYYMGDYWPTLPSQLEFYWQAPAKNWATSLPKALLKPIARQILRRQPHHKLAFDRVLFPSAFMLDEFHRRGVQVQETRIVYGAIDTEPYINETGTAEAGSQVEPLRLLYAGRLTPEKGVATAIGAVQNLVARGVTGIHLTITGGGDADYVAALHALVSGNSLDSYVTFLGPVSKDEMPDLYHKADVFLFTSVWQEPFGRVIVEAMASGVVVIGTATGGAGEILMDGENGLVFPPEDVAALAGQILRLLQKPALRAKLMENGKKTAVERFDLHRMVSEIETYLLGVAG